MAENSKAEQATQADRQEEREVLRAIHAVIGEVVLLMSNSRTHAYNFHSDVQWAVLPPIALRQYKILHNKEGATVGYISWACVSDEVLERMKNSNAMKLRPSEWNSGDHAIVMDVVGPEESIGKMLLALKKEVFPDGVISIFGHDAESGGPVLREVRLPENDGKGKEQT